MLHFFYGSSQHYIDVTQQAFDGCSDGERILIPSGDTGALFFPDPIPGYLKNVIVIRSDGERLSCVNCGPSEGIQIPLTEDEKKQADAIRGKTLERRIIQPPDSLSADEKIAFYHSQLKCTGGDITHEWREQSMVVNYLDPNATVLEIGSNIGRNTLLISCILHDERNLVTLECNPFFVELLRNNRYANGFNFHIEASALSYRKLIQSNDNLRFGSAAEAWEAIPAEELQPGYDWVPTITFAQLEEKYALSFDTLVADCEGALFYILQDDSSMLRGIKTIILESDFRLAAHKWAVEEVFSSYGFEKVHSEALVPNLTELPQECADSFWEVWQSPRHHS